MIANAKAHPRNPETVLAVGQRFHLDKVLTVATGLIETLAVQTGRFFPGKPAKARIGHGAHDKALTPAVYDEMKKAFRERHRRYEVDDFECRFDLGPLRVRARLLGWDALYEGSTFRLMDGSDWDKLDPVPTIAIHTQKTDVRMTQKTDVRMTDPQRKLVTKVCAACKAQGIEFDLDPSDRLVKPLAFVTFPFDTFGSGLGALRIRLVT